MADYKANRSGLNFNEYMRHLIAKDTESVENRFEIIEPEDIQALQEGLDESKDLKFIISANKEDFKRLLEKFHNRKSKKS